MTEIDCGISLIAELVLLALVLRVATGPVTWPVGFSIAFALMLVSCSTSVPPGAAVSLLSAAWAAVSDRLLRNKASANG